MVSCHNIFKRAGKESRYSFYPVYNLLILLDIVNMDRIYFILLLFPIVNVLTILLILYRISIIFHTSGFFALGLILLPFIFLPILNFSNMYVTNEEKEIKDDVSKDAITLLTQEEFDKLNKTEEEKPSVDNIFKIKIEKEEPAPIFRANKIKYDEMVFGKKEEPIKPEKVEPVIIEDIKPKFINEKVVEEDDSIEIVEL